MSSKPHPFRFLALLACVCGSILSATAQEGPMDRLTLEGYAEPGYGRHIVFIAGDDEYRSEETMPMLGKILAKHHGFKCTVLFSQDPENPGVINPNVITHIPGLEELRTADLLILNTRFRNLPDAQMQEIDAYLRSGRPVIGLRTSNHGFKFPADSPWAHYGFRYKGEKEDWHEGFGAKVLGSWFFSHHGWHGKESTRGIPLGKHEILKGIEEGDIWGTSDVYGVKEPIPGEDVNLILRGQVLAGMEPDDPPVGPGPYDQSNVPAYITEGSNDKNEPMQALAWTKSYQLEGGRKGRVFSTTLGASEDFIREGSRRLVINAACWCLGLIVPDKAEVTPVGTWEPTRFRNFKSTEHWEEVNRRIADLVPEEPLQLDPREIQGEVAKPYFDVEGGREGYGYDFADHPVNAHRLYNFYARQAEYYLDAEEVPNILPGFPGLDAGTYGHWGAFHKNGYKGRQWNLMDVGAVFANIFRHGPSKAQMVRAIAVKLGEGSHVVFDTETLSYTHFWEGDFVKFDPARWGIGRGIEPAGTVTRTELTTPVKEEDFRYLGYYRQGEGVTFHYRIGDEEFFDTPGLNEDGEFTRTVSSEAPAGLLEGSDPLYADRVITLRGTPGERIAGSPFTMDRIPVPLQNEFGSSMLIGGHDFFSNGDAAVCTMFGDVWRVSGLNESLEAVTWQRIATGLNQALGLYIDREEDDALYVVGRDRISRLHDLNGDLEIDHYENFNDTYRANTGGHSFHTGLQRGSGGYFYFVAAEDGLVRVSPDGSSSEIMATGLRNANGVGADPKGSLVTTSNNEGDWTPTSAVYEVVDGDFYGRGAKEDGPPIAPPLAYIPRGLDNSSGGQVIAPEDTWGALGGQIFHFSFGAGTWMMVLRDEQEGERTQGAVVPLPGDFESGAHRGRFHPIDGQIYVTGADGWGNYAITDGDFVRVRYSSEDVHLPTGFEAWKNGLVIEMAEAVDPASLQAENFFAQMWNYQHSAAYGSMEWSIRTPSAPGHDPLDVHSVHPISEDGRRFFVEMPELVPAMQMQLFGRIQSAKGEEFHLDLYPTLIALREDFTDFPDYETTAAEKETDLTLRVKWPVPFTPKVPQQEEGRLLNVTCIAGLAFEQTTLRVKAGENLSVRVTNRDSIPHNWVLGDIASFETIGQASNHMMANPNADKLHYVPELDEVLHYTPMLERNQKYTLHIQAPETPGVYPFLCTFPGHWLIMKGEMIVE